MHIPAGLQHAQASATREDAPRIPALRQWPRWKHSTPRERLGRLDADQSPDRATARSYVERLSWISVLYFISVRFRVFPDRMRRRSHFESPRGLLRKAATRC